MVGAQDLLKAQTRREGLLEEYKVAVVAVRSHPWCDLILGVISSWVRSHPGCDLILGVISSWV